MLKKELLEILACPVCTAEVEYNSANETLTCVKCGRVYQIKDGIPIMLAEESEPHKDA